MNGENDMRKLFLFIALTLACGISANLYAQVTMPAGASDKNLEDRDVKGRSAELERVKRDTEKETANSTSESKFSEIKEDFEKIQMINGNVQNLMVAKEISIKSIYESSAEINKRALRLKSNLFPNAKTKKSKDKNKSEEAPAEPPTLKTLTDMMNVSVFDFTHNAIFSNQKFTDADSAKAQEDLEKIINYSLVIKKQTEKSN